MKYIFFSLMIISSSLVFAAAEDRKQDCYVTPLGYCCESKAVEKTVVECCGDYEHCHKELIKAAFFGDLKKVRWLIEGNKCAIDDRNRNGQTALMMASLAGHLSLVRYLVALGSLLSKENNDHYTARMLAAMVGHYDVAEFIAKREALIDPVKEQLTQEAAVLKLLLEFAEEMKRKSFVVRSFLPKKFVACCSVEGPLVGPALALMTGQSQGEKKLSLKKAVPPMHLEEKKITLFDASQCGNLEAVKRILKAGADIDSRNNLRKTALMVASFYRYENVADYLIANKAKIDLCDKDGQTALMLASRQGCLPIVQKLLRAGAQVHMSSKSGMTGLMVAAMGGNYEIVKAVLEEYALVGVDVVDVADPLYKRTPLLWALLMCSWARREKYSFNGHLSEIEPIVKLLVDHGASASVEDKKGNTALYLAALHAPTSVYKFLFDRVHAEQQKLPTIHRYPTSTESLQESHVASCSTSSVVALPSIFKNNK